MKQCTKCHTDSTFLVRYTDLEEDWGLCHVCNATFDNRAFLLREFMKEDFGSFPLSDIQKHMITARMNRAVGQGAWSAHG